MKKVALCLAIVFLIAAAALGLFIATFDADRFRPLLVDRLREALGRPVSLARISLGVDGGIAVRLHDLAVGGDAADEGRPTFRVESASAVVRLIPLLQRRLEVVSIVLDRPQFEVVRDHQGDIRLDLPVPLQPPAGRSPEGDPAEIGGPSGGTAQIIMVGEVPVSFTIGMVRIRDGVARWRDVTTEPPRELVVSALNVTLNDLAFGSPMEFDVQAAFGAKTRNVGLRGTLTLLNPGAPGALPAGSIDHVTLAVDGLPLAYVLPDRGPDQPQLRGTLTVALEGRVETLETARLARAVSGSGRVRLDEPVIVNLNVMREAFEKLSMIPGLVPKLEERLPPEYQARLAATDTVLAPIDLSIRMEGGSLAFDELRVGNDMFQLIGAGRITPDGFLSMPAALRVDRTLSAAIISSVRELRALANAEGEIAFPITVHGPLSRLAVAPDLNYITSKVVVTTAVDFLGDLLRKDDEEGEAGSPDDSLLGGILRRVLAPDQPSPGTATD